MPLLPADNLTYPVRISIGTSTGSGFYCNTDSATYLATAKHVLFRRGLELYHSTATLDSVAENSSPVTITVDCAALLAWNDLKKHGTADVAVLKIASKVEQDSNELFAGRNRDR